MSRRLILLSLLLCPPFVSAEDASVALARVKAAWTHDRLPAADIPQTWSQAEFSDENGKPDTAENGRNRIILWFEDKAIGGAGGPALEKYDPEAADMNVPLFDFSEPYTERLNGVEVLSFKRSALSVYYVRQRGWGDLVYLSRRDKPELLIAGRRNSGWHVSVKYFPYRWRGGGGDKDKQAVSVPAPEGIAEGVGSPMTGALNDTQRNANKEVCRKFWEVYKLEGYSDVWAPQILGRRFLPIEHELSFAKAVPPAESALRSDKDWDGMTNIIKDGTTEKKWTDKVDAFVEDKRSELGAYARRLSADLKDGGAPGSRFTPEESRFLICRMRHVGPEAESAFSAQLDALAQTDDGDSRLRRQRGFVAYWRRFTTDALDDYDSWAQAGDPTPLTLPLLESADKALKDATTGALAGMSEIADWTYYRAPARRDPPKVADARSDPSRKVAPAKAKKTLEDAGAWAEDLIK